MVDASSINASILLVHAFAKLKKTLFWRWCVMSMITRMRKHSLNWINFWMIYKSFSSVVNTYFYKKWHNNTKLTPYTEVQLSTKHKKNNNISIPIFSYWALFDILLDTYSSRRVSPQTLTKKAHKTRNIRREKIKTNTQTNHISFCLCSLLYGNSRTSQVPQKTTFGDNYSAFSQFFEFAGKWKKLRTVGIFFLSGMNIVS